MRWKISVWISRNFQRWMEPQFPEFRKRGQPCEAHRIFRKLSFYDFPHGILPEILVQWLAVLKFNYFRSFLNRSQEITEHLSHVQNFWLNGKRPCFHWWRTWHYKTLSYIILGVNLSSLTNQNREQVPVSISSSHVKRGTAFIIHLVQQGRGFAYQRAGYFHVPFQGCYMKCCPTL